MYKACLFLIFLCNAHFVLAQIENCTTCHQPQVSGWQQSDHAKAMAVATPQTVLADFSGSTVNHFSQTATFYINNNSYFAELTDGFGGNSNKLKEKFELLIGENPAIGQHVLKR